MAEVDGTRVAALFGGVVDIYRRRSAEVYDNHAALWPEVEGFAAGSLALSDMWFLFVKAGPCSAAPRLEEPWSVGFRSVWHGWALV